MLDFCRLKIEGDIEGNENNLVLELDKLEYRIPLICIEFFLKDDYKDFSIYIILLNVLVNNMV